MEFPVFQVVPISPCPVTRHHWESPVFTPYHQELMIDKVISCWGWTIPITGPNMPDVSHWSWAVKDHLPDLPAMLFLMQPRTPVTSFAARAHWWLMFSHSGTGTPKSFSCKAAFWVVGPQSILVHGVIPPQVQDLTFLFIGYHEAPARPILQPVHDPVNGRTPI